MAIGTIIGALGIGLQGAGLFSSLFGGSDNAALESAKINYYYNSQLLEAQRGQRRTEIDAELSYREKYLKEELDYALKSAALEAQIESMGLTPSYATIEAGKVRADQKREETIRTIHAMEAAYGAAGVTAEGSPMAAMMDTAMQGQKTAAEIERIAYMEATEDRGAAKRVAAAQAGLAIAQERANLLYNKEMSGLDLTRQSLARTEAFEEEWAKKGKIYGYYALQATLGAYAEAKTATLLTQGSSILTSIGGLIPKFSQLFSGSGSSSSNFVGFLD